VTGAENVEDNISVPYIYKIETRTVTQNIKPQPGKYTSLTNIKQ